VKLPVVEMSEFAQTILEHKYAHTLTKDVGDLKAGDKEHWENVAYRVTKNVMKAVGVTMRDKLAQDICMMIAERKFIPGGRYLYASGRGFHQVNNCLLFDVHDSREGWAELLYKTAMSLMTGAGIGVVYSNLRAENSKIRKTGGFATGPVALMQMVNENARGIQQGGSRRSAVWAGLNWKHPDIHKFIRSKNWIPEVQALKERDFSFPATLDCTNISVLLDDEFFEAYHDVEHAQHTLANSVYWATIEQMLSTGEPGFSIDIGKNKGETLRNACCELTTSDSDDVCCLGSLNFARIESIEEFKQCVNLAIAFLLAGTVYSDTPFDNVDKIRTKNRRLGLGPMGLHEWLLLRGKPYGPDDELAEWFSEYAKSTEIAHKWCDEWDLTKSKKTRAVAPTGTISIIGETTSGIEPIFCTAYKRRYLKHKTWHHQYVIDPTAKRLIDTGVDPKSIEDAYTLAADVERRVAFQAWVQEYVDHGISSTINLPHWGSEWNNSSRVQDFGNMLIKYLPKLRGITCYPDGSRGGQPLVPVKYETALKHEGAELVEEAISVCDLTRGGDCGS
jgi:ribonucleoside-diphosphate reductase alpha chain